MDFSFKTPMLCKSISEGSLERGTHKLNLGEYNIEPKFDGARALLVVQNGGVEIFSRSGRSFKEHLPHLVEEVESLGLDNLVLDGEIALVTGSEDVLGKKVQKTNFNKTMRVLGSLPERGRRLQMGEFAPLSFLAYDLTHIHGRNVTGDPYFERKIRLLSLPEGEFVEKTSVWSQTEHGTATPEELPLAIYERVLEIGGEGVVLKNNTGVYKYGGRPNKNQYKIKKTTTADVVITGYKEGTGKYDGLVGSVNFSRWTEDGMVYVGRCSGMTDAMRREISENRDEYLGRVIEVSFNDLVGDSSRREFGTPRHPQFLRLRESADKGVEECDGREFKFKD